MPKGPNTALEQAADRIMLDAGDQVCRGKVEKIKGRKATKNPSDTMIGKKQGPKKVPFDLKSVADVLIAHGYNPTEEILRVMPELDAVTRAKLSATLLEYIEPKKRSVEHTGHMTHTLTIDELIKNAK